MKYCSNNICTNASHIIGMLLVCAVTFWKNAKWGVIVRVSAHKTKIYVFMTGRVSRLGYGLDCFINVCDHTN